jgi:hypothetical protein
MSKAVRPARRAMPAFDTQNDIGFVARARFALIENRTADLTADEQVQLNRCMFCDDQIRSGRYYNDRALRNFLMAKFDCSWDTANRDIQNTKQIFNTSNDNQEYLRSVITEKSLISAEKAEAAGDFKAAQKHRELAARVNHLLVPKVEKVENSKLQNFKIIVKFDAEAMGFKPVKNKEAVLEKYRKRREITRRIAEEAEDAEVVG